jgi:hypothetical protein
MLHVVRTKFDIYVFITVISGSSFSAMKTLLFEKCQTNFAVAAFLHG